MDYATAREALSPIYDSCPNICGDTGDERGLFCSNCPVKDERDNYKSVALDELEKIPGDRYGFEYLNQCVGDAMEFQALPADRRTVTVAKMIAILDAEKARRRRVEDWNKKK